MISSAEKEAIKSYCSLQCQVDSVQNEMKPTLKRARDDEATQKQALYQSMQDQSIGCVQVDPNTFARIKTCQSQRKLSVAMIVDAFASLDDAEEASIDAIVEAIHDIRQTKREYVELCKSRPSTVDVSSDPIFVEQGQAWKRQRQRLAELKKTQTNRLAELKQEQKRCEQYVQSFMQRTDIESQRVNINLDEGVQTFFIRHKASKSRPRVSKQMIADAVRAVYDDPRQPLDSALAQKIYDLLEQRPAKEQKKKVKLVRRK